MNSHKSWLFPALSIVGAMLLAGAALLYLNSDGLNAAAPSDEGEIGAIASVPVADTNSCTGGCGDCTSSETCTGEADCHSNGTYPGDGQCAGVNCNTAACTGNRATEGPLASVTYEYEAGASWTTPEGYSYEDDYQKSCTSGCRAR